MKFWFLCFSVISANLVLISRAFRNNFIIPDFQGFTKFIEEFYWKCKSNSEGKVGKFICCFYFLSNILIKVNELK